jgi:hypothetical protein
MFYRVIIFISIIPIANTYGQGVDSLKIQSTRVLLLIDSLNDTDQNRLDPMSSLTAYEKSKPDSISVQQGLNDYSERLNDLMTKLTSKIDSLNQSSIQNALVYANLNRLRSQLDSISTLTSPTAPWQPLESTETLTQSVSGKMDSIQNKVNQKLSVLSKNSGNISGSINLPEGNLNALPTLDRLNIDRNLTTPNINLPNLEMPGQDAGAPDIGGNVGSLGLPTLPDEKLTDIKAVQDVNKLQGKLDNAAQIGDQVKDYQEDLNERADLWDAFDGFRGGRKRLDLELLCRVQERHGNFKTV